MNWEVVPDEKPRFVYNDLVLFRWSKPGASFQGRIIDGPYVNKFERDGSLAYTIQEGFALTGLVISNVRADDILECIGRLTHACGMPDE